MEVSAPDQVSTQLPASPASSPAITADQSILSAPFIDPLLYLSKTREVISFV